MEVKRDRKFSDQRSKSDGSDRRDNFCVLHPTSYSCDTRCANHRQKSSPDTRAVTTLVVQLRHQWRLSKIAARHSAPTSHELTRTQLICHRRSNPEPDLRPGAMLG